jgi:hypothetical protein
LLIIQKDFDGYNRENWSGIIEWLVGYMSKLPTTLKEPLVEVNKLVKTTGNSKV